MICFSSEQLCLLAKPFVSFWSVLRLICHFLVIAFILINHYFRCVHLSFKICYFAVSIKVVKSFDAETYDG